MGLTHSDHVVGLLEALGQLTERRVGVSLAEIEGWIAIFRFHIKGLCAEDRQAKNKAWKDKVTSEFSAGTAWAHRVTKIYNGSAVEEVTKHGSYCILDVLQEHRDTWKKHWAGNDEPGQGGAKDDEEYEIPKKPSVEFVKKNWRANTKH